MVKYISFINKTANCLKRKKLFIETQKFLGILSHLFILKTRISLSLKKFNSKSDEVQE